MGFLALKTENGWAVYVHQVIDFGHKQMTPCFDTQEELARYCANTGVVEYADPLPTYEEWLAVIKGKVTVPDSWK